AVGVERIDPLGWHPELESGGLFEVANAKGPARDPGPSVWREPSPRHDAVNVWMMGQRLSPGMHNGGEADLGAKMLRIARYLLERLRCGFEQKAVDDLLVLVGNGGNLLRQREDRMEILDRQQIRLPCFQPRTCRRALAGGTMPIPATAVGDLLM